MKKAFLITGIGVRGNVTSCGSRIVVAENKEAAIEEFKSFALTDKERWFPPEDGWHSQVFDGYELHVSEVKALLAMLDAETRINVTFHQSESAIVSADKAESANEDAELDADILM